MEPGSGTEVPGVGADSRRPFKHAAEPRDDLSPARARTPGTVVTTTTLSPLAIVTRCFAVTHRGRRGAGERSAPDGPRNNGTPATLSVPSREYSHPAPRSLRAALLAGPALYSAIRSARLPNEEGCTRIIFLARAVREVAPCRGSSRRPALHRRRPLCLGADCSGRLLPSPASCGGR